MKRSILSVVVAMLLVLTACTSHKKMESDDDFSVEANDGAESPAAAAKEVPTDDLSLDGAETAKSETAAEAPKAKAAGAGDSDSALENELNSLDAPAKGEQAKAEPAAPPASSDDLSLDEPKAEVAAKPVEQTAKPTQEDLNEIPPPEAVNLTPATPPVAAGVGQAPAAGAEAAPATPAPVVTAAVTEAPATINTVQYKANSNGGTIAIGSSQPLTFTTRLNATTNQFVVEVQNSLIPKKLKRTLNTKDMASSIGSVDIYQKEGSNVSRFVVQLRPGAAEPIVQPEGNSLLIIGGANAGTAPSPTTEIGAVPADSGETAAAAAPAPEAAAPAEGASMAGSEPEARVPVSSKKSTGGVVDLNTDGLLNYASLEDFLMSNSKFYGKKISIETADMDIRDAIKFIADESNTNIIMDDGLSGRVNIKLREVPWDQAFVLLLKSKKLVYKRQGNVIRVARLEDIKKDEEDAILMKDARRVKEPLIVKRFFIGYAPIDDLATKIKDYLTITDTKKAVVDPNSSQGKVIADKRTNSLIVTETEENIKKIQSLLTVLDTQPQQILIEGKVVEAQESFSRGLGISWIASGAATGVNKGKFAITPKADSGPAVLTGDFTWGQLDFLGSLTASLSLGEKEQKVKILSSPRITVLSSESASISSNQTIQIEGGTTTGSAGVTASKISQTVGINLTVTPQASNEGTVSLTLGITRSFAGAEQSTFSRSASTKVIVKSGQTAVVGGIYESNNSEATSGIPGLSSVPVIGNLFKTSNYAKDKNELLIFVTPTILKPIRGEETKSSFIK